MSLIGFWRRQFYGFLRRPFDSNRLKTSRALADGTMKIVISDTAPYFLDLDAPTLPAYEHRTADGLVVWGVRYAHCGAWHGPGEGHRLEHCARAGTPYRRGYNLAYAGHWESKCCGS